MKDGFVQNTMTAESVKKVKRFMFNNNLYQADIARALGLSKHFVCAVINGKANFSERTVFNLEKYMDSYENQSNQ